MPWYRFVIYPALWVDSWVEATQLGILVDRFVLSRPAPKGGEVGHSERWVRIGGGYGLEATCEWGGLDACKALFAAIPWGGNTESTRRRSKK